MFSILIQTHASAPAEALAKHFDPQHIDDSLGGQIPVAQLWQQDKYAQRMKVRWEWWPDLCLCVFELVIVACWGGRTGTRSARRCG